MPGRRWSDRERELLRLWWGQADPTMVSRRLPGRTWRALGEQAAALGIVGVKTLRGMESLDAAARRTGFSNSGLRGLLAWAGVRTRRYHSPVRRQGARLERLLVARLDVDDAVHRWLASETVAAAARVRGVDPSTLRTWLAAEGIEVHAGAGRRVRVASEVIDRVVSARREARRAA